MNAAKKFVEAITPKKKTTGYDTTGTVNRVEGNTAWIQFPGGIDETPVEMSINVAPGDSVNVHVAGGRAWVTGNNSAPPTDDQTAIRAVERTNVITKTVEKVKEIAERASKIAGNTNQYFWHTETGGDTGAHITEIPQEDFLADPDNGGGNLLARSNGIAVREGLTELATFQQSGMDVNSYDPRGNLVSIAHIGYGEGNTEAGTLSDAPFYNFGTRANYSDLRPTYDASIGNYSIIEGGTLIASGAYSHAEGGNTEAHGIMSHAEGFRTYATGNYSHTEGEESRADGEASHAHGILAKATSRAQTVIGERNVVDTSGSATTRGDYAFIIGNGTNGSGLSNAAAITWTGDLRLQGDIYTGCSDDSSGGQVISDYVTSKGTSGSWRYRKWSSGKIEAWFEGSYSVAASSLPPTAVGNIYRGAWNVTIPSAIGFSAAPKVIIANGTDATHVFALNGSASSATAISGYYFRANTTSTAFTIYPRIYAWQN